MLSFKRSLFIYGFADVISKSIGLITSPITTRLLTVSQYGAGPLLTAVWAPFALIQYGGFDWAYSFFLAKRQVLDDRKRLIITATFFAYISLLIVWLIFLVVAFMSDWLTSYADITKKELLFFVLGLLPTGLIYWLCYLLRFLHRADSYVRISLFGRVLPVVIVLPLLPFFSQQDRLLASLALGWILSGLAFAYALYEVRRIGEWPFSKSFINFKQAGEMIKYSLALLPGSAAYALVFIADRLLIGYYLGPEAVAVFAISVAIGSVGVMVVGWFGLAFDPHLLQWIASGDSKHYLPKLNLLAIIIAWFFGALAVLAAIWSGPIIDLLYPKEYASSASLVPLLIFAAGITGLSRIGVATVLISQKPRYYSAVQFIALGLNVILGVILIPKVGIIGAVISGIATELVILLGWIYIGRIHLRNLEVAWTPPIVVLLLAAFLLFLSTKPLGLENVIIDLLIKTLLTLIIFSTVFFTSLGRQGVSNLHSLLFKRQS
jgi:O-antigen/teichoic acid export membrane protein